VLLSSLGQLFQDFQPVEFEIDKAAYRSSEPEAGALSQSAAQATHKINDDFRRRWEENATDLCIHAFGLGRSLYYS
jgi:hypothetical protein